MNLIRKRVMWAALLLGIVAAVSTPASAIVNPTWTLSLNHKALVRVCIDVRMNCQPVTLFPR